MATAAPDAEPRRGARRAPRRARSGRQQRRPPGQPINDGLFSTRPPRGGPPPGESAASPLEEPLPEDVEGAGEEERDEDDQGRRQRRDEEEKDEEEGEKEGEEKEGEEERRDEGEEKPEKEGEREPREEPQEREPGGERPEGETPEKPPSPRAPSGAAGEAGGGAEGLGAGAETGAAGAQAGATASGAGTAAGAAGAGAAGAGAAGTAAAGAAGTAAAGAAAGTVAAGAGAAAAAGAGTAPIWIPIVIIVAVVLLLLIILVIIISFAGEGLGGRTTGIPGDGQRPRDLAVTNGQILDQTILGRGQGAQGTFPPIPAGTRAAQIVQLAQAEVGNCEQPLGSNTGPRIRTYKRGAGDSLPWCASFSTYVLKNAGVPIGHERAAKGVMRYYENNRSRGFRWIPKGSGEPAPGDIFVRDRCPEGRRCANGHIGIVVNYDRSTGAVRTIEGNVDLGCVQEKVFAVTSSKLLGFGRYIGQ